MSECLASENSYNDDDPILATLSIQPSRILDALREYSIPSAETFSATSIEHVSNILEQMVSSTTAQLDMQASSEGNVQHRDNIIRRQAKLDLQLRRLRSLRAPIRKLSYDILHEIFAYLPPTCVGFTTSFSRILPAVDDRTTSSLGSASLVCLYWRQVCLSSPALWSTFSLGSSPEFLIWPYDLSPSYQILFPDLIPQHLRYSRSSPLHIRVSVPDMTPSCRELFLALWVEICKEQHRWASLVLEGQVDILFQDDRAVGPFNLPLLAELGLPSETAGSLDRGEVITTFKNVPSLRSVTMTGLALEYVDIPWAQIKTLKISDFSTNKKPAEFLYESDEVLEFLSVSSSLQELTIDGFEDGDSSAGITPEQDPKGSCQYLKSLDLSGDITISVLRMLTPVGCPSLTSLKLRLRDGLGGYSGSQDTVKNFFSFIPRLEILELSTCVGEDWESILPDILQSVPSLTSLTLRDTIPNGSAFYDAMMGQPSGIHLLPLLTTWRLLPTPMDYDAEITEATLTAILNVCSSRRQFRNGTNLLSMLQLYVNKRETMDWVLREASQSVEQGLKLKIECGEN